MKFLPFGFVLCWGLTTAAWLSASRRPSRREGAVGLLARAGWLAHLLLLFTAVPFVWAGGWTLGRHAALLFLSAAGALLIQPRALPRGTLAPSWGRLAGWALLLASCFWLQRNGIYHLYATHDPSAYLSAGFNLSRTGQFFHHNPVQAAAHADHPELLPLITEDERLLTLNYGLTPNLPKQGLSSFHGLFAEPLYLAVGIGLFGEEHSLWIHLLALATSLLLVVSLVRRLIGRPSHWEWAAALLLAISPLGIWIYREPLSEPLAQVFFLGMVHSLAIGHRASPAGLTAGLAASLLTRISGLLYVPFAALMLWAQSTRRPGALSPRFRWLSAAALGLALATALHASGSYLTGTIGFYVDILTRKLAPSLTGRPIPGWVIALGAALSWVSLLSLPPAWGRALWRNLRLPRVWRALWVIFAACLAGALAFRYGKLLTRLPEYVGGYPFVIYNLESWIFYAGPLVVALGGAYWARRLYAERPERLIFLQAWLPFCVFFYLAFRFLPLTLQPNFQRYLLIELVPLSVAGAAAALASIERRSGALARGLASVSLAWVLGVTWLTYHAHPSAGALGVYRDLRAAIRGAAGERPVIVFVAPTWRGMTLLAPLSHAFGIPVLQAHHGFTHAEQRAIAALKDLGYRPVLAVEMPQKADSLLAAGTRWTRAFEATPCFDYPSAKLSAPPAQLATTCYAMRFLTSDDKPAAPVVARGGIVPAWRFESESLPASASNWVGARAHGPTLCREKRPVHLEMQFLPDRDFALPTVEINGRNAGIRHVHALARGPSPASHDVDVLIPASDLDCSGWNDIDVFFLPQVSSHRRTAALVSWGEGSAGGARVP